jgi:MFS family permease
LSYFNRAVQIAFFVGNMVGVLMVGPLSDWYGRKTAYMTALTFWAAITILGYFVDNPYGWIVTRFIAGACSLAYNTAADVYR